MITETNWSSLCPRLDLSTLANLVTARTNASKILLWWKIVPLIWHLGLLIFGITFFLLLKLLLLFLLFQKKLFLSLHLPFSFFLLKFTPLLNFFNTLLFSFFFDLQHSFLLFCLPLFSL